MTIHGIRTPMIPWITSMVLVSQPLTSDNYNLWRRSIKLALAAKNKFMFIDGSLSRPDPNCLDHQLIASWDCNNNNISSWIVNSVLKEMVARLCDNLLEASLCKISTIKWAKNVLVVKRVTQSCSKVIF